RVLDHEEGFFLQQLRILDAPVDLEERAWREQMRKTLAALTLRGGSPSQESLRVLLRELHRQDPLPAALERATQTLDLALNSLYGAPASDRSALPYVIGLEPDLLGEAMVYRALGQAGRDAPMLLERLLIGATFDELRQCFVVLGNLTGRFSERIGPWLRDFLLTDLQRRAPAAFEAAKALGKQSAELHLGDILAGMLVEHGAFDIAHVLYDLGIPEKTISLARLCCWIVETKLEALPQETNLRGERAYLLMQLGNCQSASGQRAEALRSAQASVVLYRELAAEQVNAFRPELAAGLINLGNRQEEVGDWAAARESTVEGVHRFRELVAERPDAFRPQLAASLANLSGRQASLANKKEAQAEAQEAVELYDSLFRKQPAKYQYLLAASLTVLGNRHLDFGAFAQALCAAQRAVDLFQELTDEQPDAFVPDLAVSLNNLGAIQDQSGDLEASRRSMEAAVSLYRPLCAVLPQLHLPNLARSLTTLADIEFRLGLRLQGLAAAVEAVERCKAWAVKQQDRARPVLARALRILGHLHAELGDFAMALQATDAALELDQELVGMLPSVFRPDLALSLSNRGY
ncbi:MAG TPA: tetratricopeptide repeat protein, partial [Pseudomonadota bacterium]|nr:tetratricopeptide repeat protein [Pseudomonadota bacterium]